MTIYRSAHFHCYLLKMGDGVAFDCHDLTAIYYAKYRPLCGKIGTLIIYEDFYSFAADTIPLLLWKENDRRKKRMDVCV